MIGGGNQAISLSGIYTLHLLFPFEARYEPFSSQAIVGVSACQNKTDTRLKEERVPEGLSWLVGEGQTSHGEASEPSLIYSFSGIDRTRQIIIFLYSRECWTYSGQVMPSSPALSSTQTSPQFNQLCSTSFIIGLNPLIPPFSFYSLPPPLSPCRSFCKF